MRGTLSLTVYLPCKTGEPTERRSECMCLEAEKKKLKSPWEKNNWFVVRQVKRFPKRRDATQILEMT